MQFSPEDMKKFLGVAESLEAIRDQHLFRENYLTFDAYCRATWGMSEEQLNPILAEATLERQLRKSKPDNQ